MNKKFLTGDINSSLKVENMHVTLMDDNTMNEDCIDEPISEECCEYIPIFLSNDDLTGEINTNGSNADILSCVHEKEETDVSLIPCCKPPPTLKLSKDIVELSTTVPSEQKKSPEYTKVSSFVESVIFSAIPGSPTTKHQDSDTSISCDQNNELNSASKQTEYESNQIVDATECHNKLVYDNINVQEDNNTLTKSLHVGASSDDDDDDDDDLFFFSNMQSKKSKIHNNFKNSKTRAVLLHSNVADSSCTNAKENDFLDSDDDSRKSWNVENNSLEMKNSFSHEPQKQKIENTPDWEEFVRSPIVSCKKETKVLDVPPSEENKTSKKKKCVSSSLLNKSQTELKDSFIKVRLQVPSPEPTNFYECSNCNFKYHYLDNFIFHYQYCFSPTSSHDKSDHVSSRNSNEVATPSSSISRNNSGLKVQGQRKRKKRGISTKY